MVDTLSEEEEARRRRRMGLWEKWGNMYAAGRVLMTSELGWERNFWASGLSVPVN